MNRTFYPWTPVDKEVVGALKLVEVLRAMDEEMPTWAAILRDIFSGDVGFVKMHQTLDSNVPLR